MGHGGPATYRRLKRRFLSLTAESSGGRLLPPNEPAEGPPLKCALPLARSAAHPSPPRSSARPLRRPRRPLLWAAPRAPARRRLGGRRGSPAVPSPPLRGAACLGRTRRRPAGQQGAAQSPARPCTRKKRGPACFVSGTL